MPKMSQRISTINPGGSDGWDVFYRARNMIANGEKVIELTVGEHDIGTDPAILEAMHASAMSGQTGYALVPGSPDLRDAVAKRVTERSGVETKRENILITPGAQSALYAAHVLASGDGGVALHVDPFYATYPGTIRSAGGRPVSVVTKAEENFVPQEDDLDAAARTYQAKSLLINSPNNPTGVVYPQEAMEAICRVALRHDLWLISDEVYETQDWDNVSVSPRSMPGMTENTIVVGSMSKTFAMTGSRIGWIVAPEEAVERLCDLATNTTYGVPQYIQDASLFALKQGEAAEQKVAAPFLRRRDLCKRIIEAQDLVKMIPSGGAMYAMLDIRGTGQTGNSFAEQFLDAHKIALMPGESFGTAAAGHLRVALTVADDILEDSLVTLCEFAAKLADEQT